MNCPKGHEKIWKIYQGFENKDGLFYKKYRCIAEDNNGRSCNEEWLEPPTAEERKIFNE